VKSICDGATGIGVKRAVT